MSKIFAFFKNVKKYASKCVLAWKIAKVVFKNCEDIVTEVESLIAESKED